MLEAGTKKCGRGLIWFLEKQRRGLDSSLVMKGACLLREGREFGLNIMDLADRTRRIATTTPSQIWT